MQGKTILVSGGAGYIGSYANKILLKKGYKTLVLDNLSRGQKASVVGGEFIEGDIGDQKLLDKIFEKEKIDAVMHFAASISVEESVSNPAKYYRNNVSNTVQLLETMAKYNIKAFIFSSSAAVFGVPDKVPVSEKSPCRPINPYGHSKLQIEEILDSFDLAYGMKSIAFRYFNAAGADPENLIPALERIESNLIPLALKTLMKEGGVLKIFGRDWATKDGSCVRDYIHIHDIASAHIHGLQKLLNGGQGEIYNLGNGEGYSVLEVVDAINRVTGKKLPTLDAPRRAGDPAVLIADASKAKKELGWSPKYPDLDSMVTHSYHSLANC